MKKTKKEIKREQKNRRRMNELNRQNSKVSSSEKKSSSNDRFESNNGDVRSPWYKKLRNDYVEEFMGHIDDVRKCGFWSNVQFGGPIVLDGLIRKCIKKPMSYSITSTGDFSGIKHCCFWNDKTNTFMTWRHTPKDIINGSI